MSTSNASSPLTASLAANLRAARKARGMTQPELAKALGLNDFMAVSRWERGQHRPTDENLIALAEALGVSVSSLFAEPAAPGRPPRRRSTDRTAA